MSHSMKRPACSCLSATGDDPDHSVDERRFVTFGRSSAGHLLVVAHVQDEDAFELSALVTQPGQRGSCMKKVKKSAADELRSEYKRSDFGSWFAENSLSDSKRIQT